MADNRDDEGKFTEQFPDGVFLEAIDQVNLASTKNVAEEVGCSYDLAYRRLKDLENEGSVKKEEIRSAFIWMRT